MIEVSMSTGLLIYLGFTVAILLSIWCYHLYQHRHRRLRLDAQQLLVCEYCHTAYLGDIGPAVSRCPCCQSYNKKS